MSVLSSLIKMMYSVSEKSGGHLTMNQLKHCLMRNFGGRVDVSKTVELFLKKVKDDLSKIITAASDVEVNTYMYAFTIW